MAKTLTLAELRDRVRFLGDFQNSRKFTPAIVDREVNSAIEDTWNVLTKARPDYYTREFSATTTAGAAALPLPADFLRLRKVERRDGDRIAKLRRAELDGSHRFGLGRGRPTHYRLQGTQLVLLRVPDGAYSITGYYIPCKSVLVADGDTFDGINGLEEHAVVGAVLKLKMREGMPAGEWLAERSRLEKEVRDAASNLDAGAPYFLNGRERGDELWGLEDGEIS